MLKAWCRLFGHRFKLYLPAGEEDPPVYICQRCGKQVEILSEKT